MCLRVDYLSVQKCRNVVTRKLLGSGKASFEDPQKSWKV